MHKSDVVIVGAGVIGLAVARALARDGRETLILEAADSFGTGVSARNSEVIHSGIYYPPGSLKAQLCISGRERLYEFCTQRGIPHRRCGKIVVATSPAQLDALAGIAANARSNGVLQAPLDRAALAALEPALSGVAGLHSPDSGILDVHAFLLALLGEAQGYGATLSCRSQVERMRVQGDGIALAINGNEPTLLARTVINCAGLTAPQVAATLEGFPQHLLPRSYLAKGSYFQLAGAAPFRHLVYPVPESGGLGIHLTLDLAGRARFGPDVEWVEQCDYTVDAQRARGFYAQIRRYWPGLPDGSLTGAYAGIRPKIAGPGEPAADFRIEGPPSADLPIVNLFGIESPGLTASLAIAERVAQIVEAI